MSNDSKNALNERHRWTRSEKQYLTSIIHSLSLQRMTDQEIVQWLRDEKKIKIGRSTVTRIKNQVEQQAEEWYLELKESRYLYLAHFKERIDTLYTVEKHLWEIATNKSNQVVDRRGALAEIHHTEKTLSSLYDVSRYLSTTQLTGVNTETETAMHSLEHCNCATSADKITHSKCRHCRQVWCATSLNQDWCPNPDCSHGIKGCEFQPYDEHYTWVKCHTCDMWFKRKEILDAHDCIGFSTKRIPPVDREEQEPLVHQDQVMPSAAPSVNFATIHNGEEIESEAWTHANPTNNDPPVKKQPIEKGERIPAHFYHKLGPRDVAKANVNKNKTVYTS